LNRLILSLLCVHGLIDEDCEALKKHANVVTCKHYNVAIEWLLWMSMLFLYFFNAKGVHAHK
jgi:hypothetical protein